MDRESRTARADLESRLSRDVSLSSVAPGHVPYDQGAQEYQRPVRRRHGQPREPGQRGVLRRQAPVDRTQHALVSGCRESNGRSFLVEDALQLVPDPVALYRVQVTNVPAERRQRIGLDREIEPCAVTHSSQDARGIVHEALWMERTDHTVLQVASPAVRVDQRPPRSRRKRDGHRVDGEVAARQIVGQRAGRYLGKRPGSQVPLVPRRGDVHGRVTYVELEGAELGRRCNSAVQLGGQGSNARIRKPNSREVEIVGGQPEQQVPDRASDQEQIEPVMGRGLASRLQEPVLDGG